MIVYRMGTSWRVLFRVSALRHAIIPAAAAALITALIDKLVPTQFLDRLFEHPYPFQPFASLVAIALVFRTNVAYNRYWEAATKVSQMSARWADAFAQLVTFEEAPMDDPAVHNHQKRRLAQATFIHLGSLMHALALQYLRRDDRLDRLVAAELSPSLQQAVLRTKISEKRHTILSVVRESTVRFFRWIPWLTPDHVPPNLPVIGGISSEEMYKLSRSDERVSLMNGVILREMSVRRAQGGLKVEAPILAGVYRELANGTDGFRQAQKIEDIPFPFAYAQMVLFLLYTFTVTFPLLAAAKLGAQEYDFSVSWLPPLISFITNLATFGLLRVAQELEDPFVHPPNDLPSLAMQQAFNVRCLAAWDALHNAGADSFCDTMSTPPKSSLRGHLTLSPVSCPELENRSSSPARHALRSSPARHAVREWSKRNQQDEAPQRPNSERVSRGGILQRLRTPDDDCTLLQSPSKRVASSAA